jgi:hypothetical protein
MCILSELALADGARVPKLISGSKGAVLQPKMLQQTRKRLEETAAYVAAVVSSLFVHLLVLNQALDALQSTAAHRTRPTLVLAPLTQLLHYCCARVAYQVFGKRSHFEKLLSAHQTAMFFSFSALETKSYSSLRK